MSIFLSATCLFFYLFNFFQNHLFNHIVANQGGGLPSTAFGKKNDGSIAIRPLSLLLNMAYLALFSYIILFGYKTLWWKAILLVLFSFLALALLKNTIKFIMVFFRKTNLVWLSIISLFGVPICAFFMFYYLFAKP